MQHYCTHRLFWLGFFASSLAGLSTPATAQVIPDATLGTGNNSITTTIDDRTDITGGLRLNSALFHSFQQFNINTGSQVYFANPADVRNIFSRVTGGDLSRIDGLLGVTGPANLFFMNPNGIIFGPNARLDISGSFFATTANALEFPDGQTFAATGDRQVPLVEVNIPMGLQMGLNPPAMLTSRGTLTTGQNLTLAAGNLNVQGQLQAGGNLTLNATDTVKIRDTVTEPFLARSGGNLTIQGNQGIDILTLNHLSQTPFVSGGNLSLVSDGIISGDAHYEAGGNFSLLTTSGGIGDFLSIYDPTITAAGNVIFGNYVGASLQVTAGGSISTGSVTINAIDPALGANPVLRLQAGVIGNPDNPAFPFPLGGTTFTTDPATTPAGITVGGNIITTVPTQPFRVTLNAPGNISTRDIIATSSATSSYALIEIRSTAGSINLNDARISTSHTDLLNELGGAGDIFINAAVGINITNGSSIESNGDLGRIFLDAGQQLTIDKSTLTTINSVNVANGTGGQIQINVPGNATTPGSITISTSSLRTPSSNQAPGGRINMTVGNAGSITLNSTLLDSSMRGSGNPSTGVVLNTTDGNITLNDNSFVTTGTDGTTTATTGSPIRITAGNVTLNRSSSLSATTASTAPGGDVTINADSVTVNTSSLISTNVQSGAAGVGGNITITTNTINLQQGGRVQARTLGSGGAGNVQVDFANNATITGLDTQSQLYSGISTDTSSTGVGGNITMNATANSPGDLTVSGGGFLSARTTSSAVGGNITLNINNLNVLDGGQILTSSTSLGNAGSVTVNALGNVTISDSRVLPTVPISPFLNPDSTPAAFLLSLDPSPNPLAFNNAADPNVEASGAGGLPFISLQRNPSTAPTGIPSRIYATQASSGDATGGTNLGAANNFDYYIFSINQDGSQAIFDIDNAASSPANPGTLDTEIFLFDALTGQLLANNDDFFPVDPGSTSLRDSRIGYNFNLAGRYVLGVARFNSSVNTVPAATPPLTGAPLAATDAYRLQVSLQNQGTGNSSLADRNPNQGLNSGLFAQSLSSGSGNNITITANSFALTNRGELSATTVGQANGGNITVTTGGGTPLPTSQNSILVDNGRIQTSIAPPVDQSFLGSATAVSGNVTLTAQSGSISLTNSDPLSQLDDSTLVSASTAGVGTGGTVTVQTTGGGSISILNGARVESRTSGVGGFLTIGGNAGNVAINAPNVTISGSTSLSSQPLFSGVLASSDTAKSGQGGSITVNGAATPGNSLVIQDGGFLSVLNRSNQAGQGIEVNVNQLQLLNGGQIVTASEGQGTAGDIAINSPNVTISGTSGINLPSNTASGGFSLAFQDTIDFSTLVPHRTNTGNAGQVDYYQFDNLTAGNRAIFDIDNASSGFNDTEMFLFRYDPATNQSFFLARNDDSSAEGATGGSTNGRDSYLDYRFDRPGTYILAVAPYSGGTIITPNNPIVPITGQPVVTPTFLDASRQYTLQTSIDRRNTLNPNQVPNSGLFAQSTAPGSGAGNIVINGQGGGQVALTNGGQIIGSTISGVGGEIQVTGLNTLTVSDSLVSASTAGDGGSAGSITVNAIDSVTISGTGGLSTQATSGNGTSGQVSVTTSQLTVQDGASITAATDAGAGNNITLSGVDTLQVSNGSNISAATQSGAAGNVIVNSAANPATAIELDNGSIAVRANAAGGTAGSVTLNARSLDLQNNSSIQASNISAIPTNPDDGNITLAGLTTLNVSDSQISASTQSGAAGSILLNDTANPAATVTLDNGILAVRADVVGGTAGSVTLNARTLDLQNNSSIQASNISAIPTNPDDGNITLAGLTTLNVSDSQISASTQSGAAGSILLNDSANPAATVTLDNGILAVRADAVGGTAGGVTLNARSLDLQANSEISAANVSAPSSGGTRGNIILSAVETLTVDNSSISASTETGEAGNLTVNQGRTAATSITLTDASLSVAASQAAPATQGNAGDILLNTNQLTLLNSQVVASTITGQAGNLNVSTNSGASDRIQLLGNSQLTLSAGDNGTTGGTAGSITLNTLALILDGTNGGTSSSDRASISASTTLRSNNPSSTPSNITLENVNSLVVNQADIAASTQTGTAGDLTLNGATDAADTVTLTNGSLVVEATGEQGTAGNIRLNTRSLTLQNNSEISAANVSAPSSNGSGGNVAIVGATTVSLDNSQLSASTQTGEAGNLTVNQGTPAASSIALNNGSSLFVAATENGDGTAGNVLLNTQQLSLNNASSIAASTAGSGTAGSLIVNANGGVSDRVTLSNDSTLAVESTGSGNAGNVALQTRQLTLQRSSIAASTVSGSGGDITLPSLDTLQATDSQILALTQTGQAGNVSITAATSTLLTNSTLSVAAEQGGTAGNLGLTTGIFRAFDNSQITVSSPTGLAGNLNLTANDFRIDRSTLSAQTGGGSGNGANITLQVFNTPLLMRNGSLISANATGTATGGNITITSPFLIALPFENSDIQANALQGQGGQINITTQAIIGLTFRPRLTPLSDITASSESGNSGTVSLNLLSATDPTKASGNLPTNLVNVSSQVTQSCAASGSASGEGGRFTIAGRSGVPSSPTAFLPAVESLSDWVSLSVDPQAAMGIVPDDRLASVLQAGQAPASTCVNTWRVQQLLLP